MRYNSLTTFPVPLHSFLLALLAFGCLLAPAPACAQDDAEEKAAAEILKIGGKVERDSKEPAKPVISVNLSLTQVNDDALAQLEHFPKLKRLALNNTPITDAGLAHLKELKELQKVYMVDTKITDAGLDTLKEIKSLQLLSLVGTQITDAGLEKLKDLKDLQMLFVFGTKVTDEGVKKLQESLPKLKIDR